MSSISSILKNIYAFVEILQGALGPGAGAWDLLALHNALKWATYCEKVCQQAEGKPYEEELNRQISSMVSGQVALGRLTLGIDLLRRSRDVLRKSLLENPHISQELRSEVRRSYSKEEDGEVKLLQHCYEISREERTLENVLAFRNTVAVMLTPPQEGQRGFPSEVKQAEIQMMLKLYEQMFHDAMKLGKPAVKDCLSRYLCLENHVEVLLHILQRSAGGECEEIIVEWFLEELARDPSLAKKLWSSEARLLSAVAAQHLPFYEAYIQHLTAWGSTLRESYPNIGYTWVSDTDVGEKTSYTDIVSHFKGLTSCQKYLSMTTLKTLHTLCGEESEHCVWRDILKSISEQKATIGSES